MDIPTPLLERGGWCPSVCRVQLWRVFVAKKFSGNRPDLPRVADLGDWDVFARYASGGWSPVKVVARRPVRHKANYWLGWKDGNLGGRDAETLATHRPELDAQVRAILCELFRFM